MESLKEIVGNVKSRVSDPLIFSFVIAWIISNWKVTVYLFLSSQFKNNTPVENIENYFDSIGSYKLFWYPLFFAIGYTVLYPYIKVIFLYLRKPGLLQGKKIEEVDVMVRKYNEIQNDNERLQNDIKRLHEEKREVSEKFNELSKRQGEQQQALYKDLNLLSEIIFEFRKVLYSLLQCENLKLELQDIRLYIQENNNLLHKAVNHATLTINGRHNSLNLKFKDMNSSEGSEVIDDQTEVKNAIKLKSEKLNAMDIFQK